MSYKCSHLSTVTDIPISVISNLLGNNVQCADCDYAGPILWICMFNGCLKIGCAEDYNDHSTLHNSANPTHSIHMNLKTKRLWCYQCEREVFMDPSPPTTPNDSDQETKDCASKSRDSGRGSYSTTRTETPERNNVFGFERNVGLNVGMGGDTSESSDNEDTRELQLEKPQGLVGLQNIGNTCYMNAALQALSNTVPLTGFFLDCGAIVQLVTEDRKPCLSRTYQTLMRDMWIKKNGGYVTPSGILYGIRHVHAMFRGYHQHDTQEFLRNFMDQLHEELKQQAPPEPAPPISSCGDSDTFSLAMDDGALSSSYESSEGEYETCDSGVSERSSLSDDTERPSSATAKRRLSRSASPGRKHRNRMASNVIDSQPSTSAGPTKKPQKYRSIISDIFDGKLLSSVQCLTCNRISSRVETFQDLSLPIPSRDHLLVLHGRSTSNPGATCSEAVLPAQDGWVSWIFSWLRSWFYGPTVTLHDCLAAFFSTDELKGDNMYSCERCNKLRNGIKFSKVLQLPEVLCIHLKRFRHELMFSSKISSAVSFPLRGLEMRPYLHKDCVSRVTSYELFSVICHHGTAGGGHYTCYSLNSGQWYEFDDQFVTEVGAETVQACQAYVLFYRKVVTGADEVQRRAASTEDVCEETTEECAYISKQWMNRFRTFAEPGPIDNADFLCHHGAVHPDRAASLERLTVVVPAGVNEYLHSVYGGCLPITSVHVCVACQAVQKRIVVEMDALREQLEGQELPPTHVLSTVWYAQWHNFVKKRVPEPPGPIDNSKINPAQLQLSDYMEVTEDVWKFFHDIYGGGPEIRIRPKVIQKCPSEVSVVAGPEVKETPEFVVPPLRKQENPADMVDKSFYSRGEPMETNENRCVADGNNTSSEEPMEVSGSVSSAIAEETNSNKVVVNNSTDSAVSSCASVMNSDESVKKRRRRYRDRC